MTSASIGERHEALRARQHPVAAVALGAGRGMAGVEVPARLDDGRRAGRELRAGELRQPLRAAARRSRPTSSGTVTSRGRHEVQRQREAAVGELLEHQRAAHRGARPAESAVRLRNALLHQPELPGLGGKLVGHRVLLVGFAQVRAQDLAREVRQGLAEELLLLAGTEVHHRVASSGGRLRAAARGREPVRPAVRRAYRGPRADRSASGSW